MINIGIGRPPTSPVSRLGALRRTGTSLILGCCQGCRRRAQEREFVVQPVASAIHCEHLARSGLGLVHSPARICACQPAYRFLITVRFRDDLPQTLDEPARGHSEVHEDFLLCGASVWRPLAGELDQEFHLVVRVFALAVVCAPRGAASLDKSSILLRVHRIEPIHSGTEGIGYFVHGVYDGKVANMAVCQWDSTGHVNRSRRRRQLPAARRGQR